MLDNVVISLILEERNLLCANLLLWDREEFHPFTSFPTQRMPLTINLLASIPRLSFEDKVRAIFSSTTLVKECFTELRFSYSDHDNESNFVNKNPNKGLINTLLQLEKSNSLLLDVSAIALRPNWLYLLEEDATEGNYWMKGAYYEGVSELEPYSKEASHPCGVYKITNEFLAFTRDVWQPLIDKYNNTSPELTAHQLLHQSTKSNESGVNSELLKNFVYSNAMSHHDGPYERMHSEGVALRRLMRDPKLAIGFGKHLFRDLETIDISYKEYRKIVRQYFRSNKV